MRFVDYLVEAFVMEIGPPVTPNAEDLESWERASLALREKSLRLQGRRRSLMSELELKFKVVGPPPDDADVLHYFNSVFLKTPESEDLCSRIVAIDTKTMNISKKKEHWETLLRQGRAALAINNTAARRRNTHQQIPADQIPQKVGKSLQSKPSLDNPYYKANKYKYAGHPDGFTFTPQYQHEFEIFDDFLTRAGVPGFSLIYGGNFVEASKGRNLQNFIAYAADGKLAWRRYYGSPRSPSTMEIFVRGEKVSLNYNTYDTSTLQDLLPEYFK